jgi:hypothetical protein
LAAVLIALAFAPALALAQSPTPAPGALQSLESMDWIPAAGAAVAVAFLIVGVAYMLGSLFSHGGIIAWAKGEFWEAVMSGVMVAMVFFIAALLGDLAFALAGQDHIAAGNDYLVEIGGQLLYITGNALGTIQMYSYLSSSWVRAFVPIPLVPMQFLVVVYLRSIFTLAIFAGYSEIVQGVAPIFYLLWSAWFAVMAQSALLEFARNSMMSFFLPLGIIARAFPFTRRIGGSLIALALVLYFVYPVSLAFCKVVLDVFPFETTGLQLSDAGGGLVNQGFDVYGMLTGQNVHAVVNALTPAVQRFVLVMMLTILNFVIAVTSFRALAESVGGDPQIFGLSKLGV